MCSHFLRILMCHMYTANVARPLSGRNPRRPLALSRMPSARDGGGAAVDQSGLPKYIREACSLIWSVISRNASSITFAGRISSYQIFTMPLF